jgi:hypothetical protein
LDLSEEVSGGTLEYYAVLKDEWGFKTYYGTEDVPHQLAIEEEKPPKKDDSAGFGHLTALLALVFAVLAVRYRSTMRRGLT